MSLGWQLRITDKHVIIVFRKLHNKQIFSFLLSIVFSTSQYNLPGGGCTDGTGGWAVSILAILGGTSENKTRIKCYILFNS